MSAEENIAKKCGRNPGFKVPEGYFEQLYSTMPSKLPKREAAPEVKMSTWQRIKPYVYLAAMFAGIWCMMKMFHMMSATDVSLENPPAEVVAAVNEAPVSFEEMIPDYAYSDFELEHAVSEEYSSFDELEEDLNYKLEPQYEAMRVKIEPGVLPTEPAVAQHTEKKQKP